MISFEKCPKGKEGNGEMLISGMMSRKNRTYVVENVNYTLKYPFDGRYKVRLMDYRIHYSINYISTITLITRREIKESMHFLIGKYFIFKYNFEKAYTAYWRKVLKILDNLILINLYFNMNIFKIISNIKGDFLGWFNGRSDYM